MLDAIYVALTGLQGASRGLNEVANNTANVNTPGFKAANVPLVDAFYTATQLGQQGHGVRTQDAVRNFAQGEIRTTGAPLDLAIDGQGFFVLQNASAERRYTRAGRFGVSTDGFLQNTADGANVMGLIAGALRPINIANQRTQAGRASSVIKFRGNLSSTTDSFDVGNLTLVDEGGKEHTVSLNLSRDQTAATLTWNLKLTEGTTVLGQAAVEFVDGQPTAATSKPVFNFALSGAQSQSVTLDLSSEVTSFAGGNTSSLALASRDGYTDGTLSTVGFDVEGHLVLGYSNGQSVTGEQVALARFAPDITLDAKGDNQFAAPTDAAPTLGVAGKDGFGTLRPGGLEASNVDLVRELSNLIALQRGYQASSQVLGTASDMLEKLFDLGGRKK